LAILGKQELIQPDRQEALDSALVNALEDLAQDIAEQIVEDMIDHMIDEMREGHHKHAERDFRRMIIELETGGIMGREIKFAQRPNNSGYSENLRCGCYTNIKSNSLVSGILFCLWLVSLPNHGNV